jgi:hypothetical protein
MLKKYGVLGTGRTSKNIIEDALNELGVDNDFVVTCGAKPSESESRVINWLIDMEVNFMLTHNGKAPAEFIEKASVERLDANPARDMINYLSKTKGTLLLLWDDTLIPEMEEICFDAADAGVPILDLTNGLVPIAVDITPEDKPTPVQTEEVEIEAFTREEMLSMSIGVLRRTAKSQGIQVGTAMTKEQIVDAIIHDVDAIINDAEGIEPVIEEEEEILPPIDLGTFHVVSSATNDRAITSSYNTCMLTATFPSGVIMSRPANVEEVKQLFGFGATI